jgi:hypothetical protein
MAKFTPVRVILSGNFEPPRELSGRRSVTGESGIFAAIWYGFGTVGGR